MANYESALTGQQMDAALTEVALYNPEAWAVGTRNGVNVTSADETYHNNSKYYAQVAKSAIPGTYTAAVRWDIAQGLAEESQEQARANIAAGASNRNLLDNPFFTVNQRNATSVNTNGDYIADRWKCTYGSGGYTATRNSDGSITLTPGVSTSQATMYEILEQSLVTALSGKTVTVSVMLQNGSILTGTGIFSATGNRTFIASSSSQPVQVDWSYSPRIFSVRTYYTASTIRAIKLELGSYSTLANDVPPDYGEELLKCMRYFIRLGYTDTGKQVGFGYMYSTTQARILIPTPVTMRANPTVTTTNLGGAFRVNAGGTYLTPSSASTTATALPNGVNINFGTSSAGTSGAIATVFSYGEGSIDLSADL